MFVAPSRIASKRSVASSRIASKRSVASSRIAPSEDTIQCIQLYELKQADGMSKYKFISRIYNPTKENPIIFLNAKLMFEVVCKDSIQLESELTVDFLNKYTLVNHYNCFVGDFKQMKNDIVIAAKKDI